MSTNLTYNKEIIESGNTNPVLQVEGLYKSFGKENAVLKGIDFSVRKGENLVMLGKSGSGKSVAIKCLVGLVETDEGKITLFDTDISTLNNMQLNKLRLRIGFLFQNSALYDSMSVRENLSFPLKRHEKKISSKELEETIIKVLESVGLAEAIDAA
jgi:phospholipid/cholesterol/gamma-HCH transport system ATP-binding protein